MRIVLAMIMLVGMGIAQTKPPIPSVPPSYQTQFQALMIQQKDLQANQKELVEQYKKTLEDITKVNNEGTELQNKMIDEMKLDKGKYVVQGNKAGYVEIVEKPQEKKQ